MGPHPLCGRTLCNFLCSPQFHLSKLNPTLSAPARRLIPGKPNSLSNVSLRRRPPALGYLAHSVISDLFHTTTRLPPLPRLPRHCQCRRVGIPEFPNPWHPKGSPTDPDFGCTGEVERVGATLARNLAPHRDNVRSLHETSTFPARQIPIEVGGLSQRKGGNQSLNEVASSSF
jgi:hypothetical protein